MVEIVEHPLEPSKYIDAVRSPRAGAIATFMGTTRDTFEEQQVLELQYEAYIPMALFQLRKICQAARTRWPLIGVAMAHRVGVVPIGEESVFVAVSSVHRRDALQACEFAIDEIKATVPIWKKEIYTNGEVWKENKEFFEKSTIADLKKCGTGTGAKESNEGIVGKAEGRRGSCFIKMSP
ncbi:hypothetical protein O6H91_Y044200 [Diphasiastrum complanatum]|nr:hypothetical protein O6H91_Y044200 [Diphasiastrum complanatum]